MCLIACIIVLLYCSQAHAQGGVPLVTVATDQTALNLSNQFGIPAGSAINQAGDFAFVGNGNNALFFRATGTSLATRLLQVEDQAPGFPGSQIRAFSPAIGLNSAKVLLFEVLFIDSGGITAEALLTYDGTNYRTVVSSTNVAPGSGGAIYGNSLTPGSLNDQGDISFSAVPRGKSGITFYIIPAGGTAVRIAASDDTPPPACTWCTPTPPTPTGTPFPTASLGGSILIAGSPFAASRLNIKGQMLIRLWGGLFIGSKNGQLTLVPLATSGTCSAIPGSGGTITTIPVFGNGFLNNSGVVSFTTTSSSGSSICIAPADGGEPVTAVAYGSAAPPEIGGGSLTFPIALGFNDTGDIIFQSPVSGSGITTFALLRYRQANGHLDVVAYNGEPAPGTNGSVFALFGPGWNVGPPSITSLPAFTFVSMASDGRVSFRASLSKGGNAIYRQTGATSSANAPEFIFLESQTAPLADTRIGIFFLLSGGQTKILDNGSTFFSAYLTNGAADFGEFLGTPGSVQTLLSTADPLPSGARTILPATPPQAAGHFVAFTAQPAGGRNNLFVSDLTSGTITRVVSDNDPALMATGGAPRDTVLAPNFFLNESGQVAFETVDANEALGFAISSVGVGSGFVNIASASLFPGACGTIYLSSAPPGAGLTKIVAPGDVAPNTSIPFSCVILNTETRSPLNRSGQLIFHSPSLFPNLSFCFLCDAPPAPDVNGVFLYNPGAGGTISEIVAANDTLPGETQKTTFVPSLPGALNSAGQVAFGAQIGTQSTGFQGLFVRNASGTPQKVVSSGDIVPGSSATFSTPTEITGLDENGNLTFRAPTSAGSDGIFFAPTGGSIQTIALDSGAAPGGGKFALNFPLPTTGSGGFLTGTPFYRNITLANGESDVVFHASITGGSADSGYFRLLRSGSTAGILQPTVLQGQAVPGGGTFSTIPMQNYRGSDFALGSDGTLAFVNNFNTGINFQRGLFVARPDGNIFRVLATGDTVVGGGTLKGLLMSNLAAGEAGKIVFWAAIKDGSARQAILATAIPPGTTGTIATLAPLMSPMALQPTNLTAAVSSSSSAATGSPTGKVNFFDNGVSLGVSTLDGSGKVGLTISSLVAGPHSLLAQYDGDLNFAPANSPTLDTIVTGFAAPPTGLAVTSGQSLQIPLTLYAQAGSGFSFMMSCSGLPANASCAFDQAQVTPGPSGTVIRVTVSTAARSNLLPDRLRKGPGPLGFVELSVILSTLLAIAVTKFRHAPRRRVAFGMCLASFGLVALMAGCGAVGAGPSAGSGPSGTPAGPAAITVMGTSGATTVSTVVNMTVR